MNQCDLNKVLYDHALWLKYRTLGKRANLSGADLRDANLRDADLRGADLRYADLSGADLSYANLSGADLREADLRYADLCGANLRGANLRGADLCGANLRDTGLLTFQFNRDQAIYTGNNNIRIGCELHTIEYWVDNYESIGKSNEYTVLEIQEYGHFIQQCCRVRINIKPTSKKIVIDGKEIEISEESYQALKKSLT